MYHSGILTVKQLNMDNEFACIEEDIKLARLDMVAADEHVGLIERSIRTVKECTRCHVHRCIYERYPKVMMSGVVTNSIADSNQLPSENEMSSASSSSSLITSRPSPDFGQIIKLNFGDYTPAYKRNKKTNTNSAR